MTDIGLEKAFWILFLLILCAWAAVWMLDDWRSDGKD